MTVYVPSTADVMRGIAEEIERDPSIWTQGDLWRDSDGHSCSEDSAACGCALGLIALALPSEKDGRAYSHARQAMSEVAAAEGGLWVAEWNDVPGRTPGKVAVAFRRAADLLDEGAV